MPSPDDVADVPHDFGRLPFLASESYPIERTLFNLRQRITAAGMSALGDGLPHHRRRIHPRPLCWAISPHGFRATASTILRDAGFEDRPIELQLAHIKGVVLGVREVDSVIALWGAGPLWGCPHNNDTGSSCESKSLAHRQLVTE
jgi:hypothetical protein